MIIALASKFYVYLPWGSSRSSSHFQLGEGPSKGLLRDYEPSDGPSFQALEDDNDDTPRHPSRCHGAVTSCKHAAIWNEPWEDQFCTVSLIADQDSKFPDEVAQDLDSSFFDFNCSHFSRLLAANVPWPPAEVDITNSDVFIWSCIISLLGCW